MDKYKFIASLQFYIYCVQTSHCATWSGFNFKTNVEVVLFKWENLIKIIWWLSVTYIAWGNHLWSFSYRQLVSMSCGMQSFHLVLHPPRSIDHFAQHQKSLSFGTHQWCFLTSAINEPQAYIRKRVFHRIVRVIDGGGCVISCSCFADKFHCRYRKLLQI